MAPCPCELEKCVHPNSLRRRFQRRRRPRSRIPRNNPNERGPELVFGTFPAVQASCPTRPDRSCTPTPQRGPPASNECRPTTGNRLPASPSPVSARPSMTHSRKYILDLLRACAALEVVSSHLRTFLFKNLPALQDPSVVAKVFYYLTGFAHEAVVVFFVLSGYFVGGSVIASKGVDFWPRYLVQRVSRLWIVLIPSLFPYTLLEQVRVPHRGQSIPAGRTEPTHQRRPAHGGRPWMEGPGR